MFINMLPPLVQKDIRDHPELDTLQKCIDYVLRDLGRYNDTRVAKLHSQRLKNMLHHGLKNPVNVVMPHGDDNESEGTSSNESTAICALTSKIDGLVAALNADRGRSNVRTGSGSRSPRSQSPKGTSNLGRADPKFEGCWHCKGQGHSRRACPDFKAILKANGGKLPKGYEGAYEKWKKTTKKVNAITIDSDDEDEHDETGELWALTCSSDDLLCGICEDDEDGFDECSCCPKHFDNVVPMPSSVPVSNSFDARMENDDEDEVVAALNKITSKIQVGPKTSQKTRKDAARKTPKNSIDRREIAHIAQQIRDGEIELPTLDLESNEEFEAIWALVDSGAGKSCARRSKHFRAVTGENAPSSVKMSTANGQELKSRGVFRVEALSSEGHPIIQDFEDTNVDMPITAVAELSDSGELGAQVNFRRHDGVVIDNSTNRQSHFIKRRGVYFMKLFVPKPSKRNAAQNKSSFTRPGTA